MIFTYLTTQPTVLNEGGWLVIQIAFNLTRLTSPYYNNTTCMHNCTYYNTRQWKHKQINLTHKQSTHSEWTQRREAEPGTANLWAAQM